MTNIFLSFIGISISVSLIVIVLLLFSPMLNKRYAAKWKYLIWIFLALRLLVPYSGTGGQIAAGVLSLIHTQAAPGWEDQNIGRTDAAIPSGRLIVEVPAQMTAPMTTRHTLQSGQNHAGITMLDIFTFVWLAGCLIVMAVHFISYFHYKRQVMKKGTRIEYAQILSQISKLEHELHIRHTIQAVVYEKAQSPMMIGFLKPVLVLPGEQYTPEELYFILKHELVHLKRKDVYTKLLFVTANAIHWWNPFIWMMQKEAAVDMELSCDERVVFGSGYDVRKAYTETLLSMLHKQCGRKTVLSTQFYGGIKIMKKRFKNILQKNRKKNGAVIFISAVILTVIFGTLVGCTIAKEDTGRETGKKAEIQKEDMKKQDVKKGDVKNDNTKAENIKNANAATLTFLKEGVQEQKQAALVMGNGYSMYLPDGEWRQMDTDIWEAAANDQVLIWTAHFENQSVDAVAQTLADNGYEAVQNQNQKQKQMLKQEEEIIYHAELKEFENDSWGIFYCYPMEAEEGWGRELLVIADTFALSVEAGHEKDGSTDDAATYLGDKDCQAIKTIAEQFAAAYFDGDAAAIQTLLADTYEGEIDTYEKGSDVTVVVKGLSDTDEKKIANGRYVVSLEFRDNHQEDMLMYVTLEFVRQHGEWKIQFYGLEG